ncbi:hypothetical protein N7508_009880 [Penicillium antarcticum]|uniref:uncharacterized protein n=1 Tax=Penicillium antarcticum TaxID=416450 RepID=UPI002392F3E2|nr:uncharacterized protein N7508_009880 [Penicillium antarcticum]KAJ5295059.1 hypothetical protein N7508_009880 [Penicillium antarcticum]
MGIFTISRNPPSAILSDSSIGLMKDSWIFLKGREILPIYQEHRTYWLSDKKHEDRSERRKTLVFLCFEHNESAMSFSGTFIPSECLTMTLLLDLTWL